MSYTHLDVRPHSPVRVGVIGVGWMGRFHATSVAEKVPGLVLAAIADPDRAAANAMARRLGVTKVTADAATVFADPDVDAVVVASPPRFHPTQMSHASVTGKAIFCEKPAAAEPAPTSTPRSPRSPGRGHRCRSASTGVTPPRSPVRTVGLSQRGGDATAVALAHP